jgi:hypothetical protein
MASLTQLPIRRDAPEIELDSFLARSSPARDIKQNFHVGFNQNCAEVNLEKVELSHPQGG